MTKKAGFIGLIGLGYWGKNHLRTLHEEGVLHTACDTSEIVIKERKKELPTVNYTMSFHDLINNSEITAIVIAGPAIVHFELAKAAINAGKDVFVEKPLSLTAKEGKILVDLAQRENRILMVGHILQFHPALIKLKEMVVKGQLGKIEYIYSNRLNIGKLRTEENILWSFAPHDISTILMLAGEEPTTVSSFGGDYISKGIHDTTLTTLEFKNGIKSHIFVSWIHPYKEQKLVVVGSKSMAVFDDVSKDKLCVYPHKIEWVDGTVPVVQKAECEVIPTEKGEPLRLEIQHFVDCVINRKKPKTDGEEGLRVLRILEAAEESISKKMIITREPQKNYFVHDTACVDDAVTIGAGTKVWHYSHILKNCHIGNNCVFGQNVSVGPNVKIGNNVKVQNNISIYEKVEIEDDVFCGPSMVFTINPRSFIERKSEFKKTLVKKGSTIGANATIVCGNTLGEYCLIAAGAVVTKDVPAYSLMVGVPAKQVGWVCKCGVTLKKFENNKAICSDCGIKYEKNNNQLNQILEA
jgi:UDP-2-acetamido-3-amino-2,3-dideoxy-glucuronate N-acetyltransferase